MMFGVVVGQFLVRLPLLVVLIVGVVLLSARRARLPRRSGTLGTVGLLLLAVGMLLGLVWSMAFPYLVRDGAFSTTNYVWTSSGISFLLGLVEAAGIGLLVAALVGRAGDDRPSFPTGPQGHSFPAGPQGHPGTPSHPGASSSPDDPYRPMP